MFNRKFIVDALSVIGGILAIWESVLKPICKQTQNDMDYSHYFRDNWVMLMALAFLIIGVFGSIVESRKDRKRLSAIENYLAQSDSQDMEDEIIHAVAWWVSSFNPVESERNAYIEKYFPRNKAKIRDYISRLPFSIQRA